LVPLLSFGVGSFVMVLLGGLRLRSRANIGAAVGYFLLLVYFFVAVQYTPTNGGSFPDAAVFPAFLLSWLGGTAHVLALQSVIRGSARPPVPPPAVDPALAAAGRRAQRREEARAILATKPALAGVFDAIRGPNPRLQAALLYAPGVALALSGSATILAAWGAGRAVVGEPAAAALLLVPVASADERTNAVISEPITKKMPIELAKINLFFFFISAFSF